jgi:hypothetical protein
VRPDRTLIGSNRAWVLAKQIRQVAIADGVCDAWRHSIRWPIDVRPECQQFADDIALMLRDRPHKWRYQHGTAARQRVVTAAMSASGSHPLRMKS